MMIRSSGDATIGALTKLPSSATTGTELLGPLVALVRFTLLPEGTAPAAPATVTVPSLLLVTVIRVLSGKGGNESSHLAQDQDGIEIIDDPISVHITSRSEIDCRGDIWGSCSH